MPHFKLEVEIALNCRFEAGEEIEFRYTSPAPVVVSLKQRERLGEDGTDRRGNAVCTGITVRDIEPQVKAELDSCLDGGNVKISGLKPDTLKAIDGIFHHIAPYRGLPLSCLIGHTD